MRIFGSVLAAWALSAGGAAALGASAGDAPGDLEAGIVAAEQNGAKFLLSQIARDGSCVGEYEAANPRFGGKTALCLYALVSSGVDMKRTEVQRAISWLLAAKLHGTYAVAMRACALAAIKDDKVLKPLQEDVNWLVRAAASNGAYTYTSYGGKPCGEYDNSNGQMAVLGVWAAARRGIEVPAQYWQTVERFWNSQQQSDGGWGYFIPAGAKSTKTYGSMTAAGVATLMVCYENIHREDFVRGQGGAQDKPILDGMRWLGQNFAADENPKLGANRYYYWLYCLERVGLASGYKYIGSQDWFSVGASELLTRQNAEGSWDYGTERVAQTAFSLLFLVRGRDPVAINKLHYEGKWNPRPHDMANLSRWLAYSFERPLRWQVVDIASPMTDWHDAPILYLSGSGAIDLSAEELEKLRTFVYQGGTIISEAACNNADFTLDMQRLYKRMFPGCQLARLPDDHPVYSMQFAVKDRPGLLGVSNGVRLLAVHSPRELSLGLELGPQKANMPSFELAANLFFYLTDKGYLRPRGRSPWPAASSFTPRATIRLARLKHAGNCDPEPLAWKRLALLMGNRHHIRLDVSEPMEITDLLAKSYPIAAMTGTKAFDLDADQQAALKKYFAEGGRLIVDAAGGSKEFADSVQKVLLPLAGKGQAAVLSSMSPIYRGAPEPIDKIVYRSDFAFSLGPAANLPRLKAVLNGERIVILFSPDDLTSGLLGTNVYRLKGYSATTAVSLTMNALCHLAGVSKQELAHE